MSRELRRSKQMDAWRQEVYSRYNQRCVICYQKRRGRILHAHHLYSFAKYPELRFVPENGICICKKCHKLFHHLYGNNNTPMQFIEFYEVYN